MKEFLNCHMQDAVDESWENAHEMRREADAISDSAKLSKDPAEKARLEMACQTLHWQAACYEQGARRLASQLASLQTAAA